MFNESKYKKCISNLLAIKTSIVISYFVIFAFIGSTIGWAIMYNFTDTVITVVIAGIVGAILGLIIGLTSTWRIDMKIQEAYWKIDILNELKQQNVSKSSPVAKTVVAIENKQTPKGEESKIDKKKE